MADLITSDQPFNDLDRQLLARVAELIIGQDPADKMPPVTGEQIMGEILQIAAGFERPIRKGLQSLRSHADNEGLGSIADIPSQALQNLMETSQMRSMLRAMMQVVAQAYYQNSAVLEALGFEPRPPFPKGHELEEGDWSLLDEVRQRQPFYRKT